MAPKQRKYTKRSKITRSTGVGQSFFDNKGAVDTLNMRFLLAAAEIVAETAKGIASAFSTRIPAATRAIPVGDGECVVITDGTEAPNASPFEFGKRHPLFGDTEYWYPQPKKPYMTQAFRRSSDAAMDAYAQQIDVLTEEAGYTE